MILANRHNGVQQAFKARCTPFLSVPGNKPEWMLSIKQS